MSFTLILDTKVDKGFGDNNPELITQIRTSGVEAADHLKDLLSLKITITDEMEILEFQDLVLVHEPGRDRVFLKE